MSLGIAERIEGLSTREKAMLGGMALAFFLFVGFMGYLLVGSTIDELEASVASKREALETIETLKERFMQERSSGTVNLDELLEGNKVKLTPYVEEAARRYGIQVDDYKERRMPVGKKHKTKSGEEVPEMWEELLTISFKKVDMERLTGFLEEIDKPERLIFVKKLNLKRSWSNKDQFRVTLTLSTYKKA